MCEALSRDLESVSLLYPRRWNPPRLREVHDPFAYYGVSRSFRLHSAWCADIHPLRRTFSTAWAQLHAMTFAWSSRRALWHRLHGVDAVYTRDPWLAILFARAARRAAPAPLLAFEAHTFPQGARKRWMPLLRHLDLIVVLTSRLKLQFEAVGVPSERILVAPDGVDLSAYVGAAPAGPPQCLADCNRPIALYTGHLFEWKGAHTLIEASKAFDAETVLLGGTPQNVARAREQAADAHSERVRFLGLVPPREVPAYQMAADVLVLPNSGKLTISREHTSPLKLFEYMAARRPIVASDLPSIREILTDGVNAVLVNPDDPEALAGGIQRVLDNPEWAQGLAERAFQDVQEYTWEKRARRILDRLDDMLQAKDKS